MDTYGWRKPGNNHYEVIPHIYSWLQAAQAGGWISTVGWAVIFIASLIRC